MPHLFISAAHKSSGKTTVSIGLCAALRARGLAVQPYKKGPDYIDPLWLSQAAGRPCYNLDFYTMGREEILATFASQMHGADVGLVEGNKGLYDGLDLDGSNSNAALAGLLGAPVVLVLDTRGMTRGVAPLILGYQAFDPGLRIAGVVLNHVGGSRHEGKLRRVIEHYTDVAVVGAVARSADLEIVERHLGLMPSNESTQATAQIERLGVRIAESVDLDRLLGIARTALPLPARVRPDPPPPARVRLGVARDEAFGFYYPGDLDALRRAGAELVFFDTLRDAELPAVDGLFIGGGFPEMRMEALERNAVMRNAIADYVAAGGPVYAECGGLMYLARSLAWKGKVCRMVGVIPADVVMCERPQGRGYVRLVETGESPWPAPAGGSAEIAAHEFHYSRLDNMGSGLRYAYRVLRGHGIDGEHDGIVLGNLLASYTHLRDVGGNHWTQRFVAHVAACKGARGARPAAAEGPACSS
jgi:cobyrinic acid a,c-diamide synthase